MVVTPDSFSGLPEYSDEPSSSSTRVSVSVSGSVSSAATSPISGAGSKLESLNLNLNSLPNVNANANAAGAGEDPNVVILKTFEDSTRRSPTASVRASQISPSSEISDPFCSLSLSPILDSLPSPVLFEDEQHSYIEGCLDQSQHQQQQHQPQQCPDTTLFAHFRHVVWKQLFPHDRGNDTFGLEHGMTLSVDFLEREAALFPPVSDTSILFYIQYYVMVSNYGYSSLTLSWLFQHLVSRTAGQDKMSMLYSIINKLSHLCKSIFGIMKILFLMVSF